MESRSGLKTQINIQGVGRLSNGAESHSGLGLKGMKEQAGQFGGNLQIYSNSSGTQVSVEVAYG